MADLVYPPVIALVKGFWKYLGFQFNFQGQENLPRKGGAILAMNHIGYLDFALLHADKECLVYEDERYTYKEVFEKSAQTANALINEGISKGDKVAICMQNNPEFIFAYLGIFVIIL